MFTIANKVGCLVEAHISRLENAAQVDQLERKFAEIVARHSRIVICADYRSLQVLAPEVADRFAGMLVSANPKVARSGILCNGDSPISVLQIERTVREAGLASRRTFRDVRECEAWIAPSLNDAERRRVTEFLAAGSASP